MLKNNINLKMNLGIGLEAWHKKKNKKLTHTDGLMQLGLEVRSKETRQWSQMKVRSRPDEKQAETKGNLAKAFFILIVINQEESWEVGQ